MGNTQQGLFEVDDEFSTQFNSHFLVMSPEVMRALTGCSLSTDEFFKIDKTGTVAALSTWRTRSNASVT
jgi:hypothetical protein